MNIEIEKSKAVFKELDDYSITKQTVQLLPLPLCLRHKVVVLEKEEKDFICTITLGMVEIDNNRLIETIASMLKCQINPIQLNQYEIHKALEIGYKNKLVKNKKPGHIINLADHEKNPVDSQSTVIQFVDDLLIEGTVCKASDIHLENYEDDVDLRYRIDGILHQRFTHISLENMKEVVNRFKILASLDISEHYSPQDGRFRCSFIDEDLISIVDFRLSIIPGPTGEDIVIRVLDQDSIAFNLSKLGMNEEQQKLLHRLVKNPEGLLLITGPTGSGKTTTIYSILNILKDKGKKILTAEDPIEYKVAKINQKQVSEKVDMACLSKSFLRHDPDIMLIGEIRDTQTAHIVAKATATGHLVFSTIHSSDAISTIQRLRGIGLENS